jgi:hypothetical protein
LKKHCSKLPIEQLFIRKKINCGNCLFASRFTEGTNYKSSINIMNTSTSASSHRLPFENKKANICSLEKDQLCVEINSEVFMCVCGWQSFLFIGWLIRCKLKECIIFLFVFIFNVALFLFFLFSFKYYLNQKSCIKMEFLFCRKCGYIITFNACFLLILLVSFFTSFHSSWLITNTRSDLLLMRWITTTRSSIFLTINHLYVWSCTS